MMLLARLSSRCAVGALVALLPCATWAAAVFKTDAYREVLQRGVDSGAYRQLAVGWIDGSDQNTWFYGKGSQPTAESEFEIGSLSEVFAGVLLAESAFQGKLRLDARLSSLLPQGAVIADAALGNRSLRDLATHRSGLPPVPPNLFPARIDDPYAEYGHDDLLGLLANWRNASQRVRIRYSPLDFGLLGYVISLQLAQPYTLLLQERVLAPLALNNTGFADSSTLLSGYSQGRATPHWHYRALAAGAGLRSSLSDMMHFLRLNLRPGNSPLRAALLLARRSYAHEGSLDYGLGWRMVESAQDDNAWPLVWCASRTGGFSAFIGYRSDLQQGLVLLGNTDADLSAVGLAWLRHGPIPARPAGPVRVSPKALASYTGLYAIGGGTELVIRNVSGTLSAQWSGQPAIALHAVDSDVFDTDVAGYTLSFQREANMVTSVLVAHSGFNVLANRLSRRAPYLRRVPIAVGTPTVNAMIGDYRLDNDTLVRIARDGAGVSLQLSGRKRMPLAAFAPDRFQTDDGSIELTLRRDTQGLVDGISMELAGTRRFAPRVVWHPIAGAM